MSIIERFYNALISLGKEMGTHTIMGPVPRPDLNGTGTQTIIT